VSSWVNLHALGQIVVLGLIAGAGLPALFAAGLRALSLPGHRASATNAATSSEQVVGGSPVGIAAAVLCFAVVLASVGWGIYYIVQASSG
jgi:hypothetical protein